MSVSLRAVVIYGGWATLIALIALAASQAPLGTPLFFVFAAVPCVVYALLWRHLITAPAPETGTWFPLPRLLKIALLLATVSQRPGRQRDQVEHRSHREHVPRIADQQRNEEHDAHERR